MLMCHPPQIIIRGRVNIPQGCIECLTSIQMLMVVQELVAYDAVVQNAFAVILAAFDFTGLPFTARTLVALVSFHLVLQLAAQIEMVRFVDATIEQIDTTLRCPLLDISGGGNFCGVELQLP